MKRLLLIVALTTASLAHAGDELVPVIVAAVDIPAGTKITFELISQRSFPKRLVTASIVKPDSATYVINQRVSRPLLAGDLVAWNNFEAGDLRAAELCAQKLEDATAADQVRRARAAIIKR